MAQKVLLVDDDKLLLDSESDILKEAGYETLLAHNGKEGLEIALREHPDAIVLDYQMPEMDGLEALKAIRNDDWGKDAKVVFATNIYDVTVINAALALGVTNYVLKADTSLEEILSIIQKELGA